MASKLNRAAIFATGLCILGAAVVLFVFNPAEHGFYPRCLLHSTTGLNCPGCGALRATHQLLHGNFRAAFLLNPLFIILAPLLAALVGRELFRVATGRALFHFNLRPIHTWVLVTVALLFAVLRNIPTFAWLGP